MRVVTRNGLSRLNDPPDNPPFDVKVVEDQYERLWKFYIFAPEGYRERVGEVCERVFGESNALL